MYSFAIIEIKPGPIKDQVHLRDLRRLFYKMAYAPPQIPPAVAYISSSHPESHEPPILPTPWPSRAHTLGANNDYSDAIKLPPSAYNQVPVDHAYASRLRNAHTSSVEYRYELQPTEWDTFYGSQGQSVPPPLPPKILPEIESDTKLPPSLDDQGTNRVELSTGTQWQSHSHFQSVHPSSWAELVPGTYYQNPEPPGGHEAPLHTYKHGESAPEVLRGHGQQEWKGAEAPELAYGQEAPEVANGHEAPEVAKDQEAWPPVGIEVPRLVEVEELPHLWDPSKMGVADSSRPLSPRTGDRDLEKDMTISTEKPIYTTPQNKSVWHEKPYSSPIPPDSSAKGIYMQIFF